MNVWRWFVNLFRRKRVLQAYIFDETGGFRVRRRKHDLHRFEYKGGVYNVEKERTYENVDSRMPAAFYSINNPMPRDMTHEKSSDMSASAVREVIRSDMVRDAFIKTTDNLQLLVLVLLIVTVVLLVFIAFNDYKMMGVLQNVSARPV